VFKTGSYGYGYGYDVPRYGSLRNLIKQNKNKAN